MVWQIGRNAISNLHQDSAHAVSAVPVPHWRPLQCMYRSCAILTLQRQDSQRDSENPNKDAKPWEITQYFHLGGAVVIYSVSTSNEILKLWGSLRSTFLNNWIHKIPGVFLQHNLNLLFENLSPFPSCFLGRLFSLSIISPRSRQLCWTFYSEPQGQDAQERSWTSWVLNGDCYHCVAAKLRRCVVHIEEARLPIVSSGSNSSTLLSSNSPNQSSPAWLQAQAWEASRGAHSADGAYKDAVRAGHRDAATRNSGFRKLVSRDRNSPQTAIHSKTYYLNTRLVKHTMYEI